jgi:hypothetical protein
MPAYTRAREAGTGAIGEPTSDVYGERSCMLEDLAGDRWELTQTVRDVEPEELLGVLVVHCGPGLLAPFSWDGTLPDDARDNTPEAGTGNRIAEPPLAHGGTCGRR